MHLFNKFNSVFTAALLRLLWVGLSYPLHNDCLIISSETTNVQHKSKSLHHLKNGKLINRLKVKSYLTPDGFIRGTLSVKKTDRPAALKPNNPFRLQLPKVIKQVFLEDVAFFPHHVKNDILSRQVTDAIKMIIPFNREAVPPVDIHVDLCIFLKNQKSLNKCQCWHFF